MKVWKLEVPFFGVPLRGFSCSRDIQRGTPILGNTQMILGLGSVPCKFPYTLSPKPLHFRASLVFALLYLAEPKPKP